MTCDFSGIRLPPICDLTEREISDYAGHLGIERFETEEQCGTRQLSMIKRLERRGLLNSVQRDHLMFVMEHGLPLDWHDLSAACHFARRAVKLEVLMAHREALLGWSQPLVHATCMFSKWQVSVEDLPTVKPRSIAKSVARVLPYGVIGTGAVELTHIERPDGLIVAPHVHLVCAAPDPSKIGPALQWLKRQELNRRPERVDLIRKGEEGVVINYAHKRLASKRVPYVDDDGYSRARQLPLAAKWEAELDAWLMSLKASDLAFTVGMKRNGSFLVRA